VYEQEPYFTGEKRKLKKNNISVLGQKIKSEQSTFKGSDFEVGCTIAVVDDQQIKDILENKKTIFKNNYMVCIPVDEDLSSISWMDRACYQNKDIISSVMLFSPRNANTIDLA
jgi:hypothetical protein